MCKFPNNSLSLNYGLILPQKIIINNNKKLSIVECYNIKQICPLL